MVDCSAFNSETKHLRNKPSISAFIPWSPNLKYLKHLILTAVKFLKLSISFPRGWIKTSSQREDERERERWGEIESVTCLPYNPVIVANS